MRVIRVKLWASMSLTRDSFDPPWKEIFEQYLRPILELCFPGVAAEIDWAKGFVFLDQELQ